MMTAITTNGKPPTMPRVMNVTVADIPYMKLFPTLSGKRLSMPV
jgi:hypothetical protein